MVHTRQKLSGLGIERASKKPGLYGDGGGLYLLVGSKRKHHAGACAWVFRYTRKGKAHSMGLGPYPDRTLADAREHALGARKLLLDGVDPLEAKAAKISAKTLEAARAMSFKECAEQYIASHKAGWGHPKHVLAWTNTLAIYVYPVIGNLPVAGIDIGLVMKILEPIWTTKSVTANRLRGRIEAVLNWAKVSGYRNRDGENPAAWKGNLDNLLPASAKVQKVEHHAALPFADLPAFMTALRKQEGTVARAFEFAILCAARTGEVIGATWGEVNLAEKIWIVPAERMKAGREHRVPLSAPAVALLQAMLELAGNAAPDAYLFPGRKCGASIGNMGMQQTLRRMNRTDLTVHGFRSTFRDWAIEHTNFPSEAAEMALAHTVGNKVEAAYRRGDLLERRRALMDRWGAVCAIPATRSKVA